MEDKYDTLAKNLKSIRKKRNLSLGELAELTSVSKSMLRQIELGKSSPTISTVWKIVNGLQIPFTYLLRKLDSGVKIRKFKDAKPIINRSDKFRHYPLVKFNPHRPFETSYIEIDPGAELNSEPHGRHAKEEVFVYQGQLTMHITDEEYTIDRNHFITFDANCYHNYRNLGKKMVKGLMTISYLPEE